MGPVAEWLGLGHVMDYILYREGSKAVFGSVPVYHWTATSGWIPENPLNRVEDGDNKFLPHGYLVSILDQQGGVSCDIEAGWPSLRHSLQFLK